MMKAMPPPEETRGEYLVGASFNPTSNPEVDEIKRKSADLIDAIGRIQDAGTTARQTAEIGRCKSIAVTNVEQAAMWAVKAVTKQP